MRMRFTLTMVAFQACFLLFRSSPGAQRGGRDTAVDLLARYKYRPSQVSVLVKQINADSPLVAIQADSMMIPASVQKLVTAAAALEILGSTYTFKTRLFAEKGFDPDSGLVRGDLYIKGGADPGLYAERLWLFTQQLYHRGIHHIQGDIILDESFLDTIIVGPGFGSDNSSRAYEAPVGALSANFNTMAIHQRPGSRPGSPVHVDVFPEVPDLKIESTAKTVAEGASWAMDVRTGVIDGKTALFVYGSMPVAARPKYSYRKVWSSGENFSRVLRGFLDDRGISLGGTVRTGTLPDSIASRDTLFVFESQPLTEFVTHMFKYSSNFAAEMIFKTIGAEKGGGRNGSWDSASAVVGGWWKDCGLPGMPAVRNGSGMGAVNRISARQIVSLLEYAWGRKQWFPDYCASLSVSGADGTLKDRFGQSKLKGIVRAKTGTLNDIGVSSLAGYALYPDAMYAFAILINTTGKGQADHWQLQEKLLEAALP